MPTSQPANTPAPFPAAIARLRHRLATPLPGHAAHLTMAPSHRVDPELLSVEHKRCREAAVLVLLYRRGDEIFVVLTARPASLRDHAGQVSFPGGSRESGETFEEAALREAHEEIGLDPRRVEVIGALTPIYIPPSGFCVYPFVAVSAVEPPLAPVECEVERILHVPVRHLLNPDTREQGEWEVRGEISVVPYYRVESYKVWGATAMMLAELLEVVR